MAANRAETAIVKATIAPVISGNSCFHGLNCRNIGSRMLDRRLLSLARNSEIYPSHVCHEKSSLPPEWSFQTPKNIKSSSDGGTRNDSVP